MKSILIVFVLALSTSALANDAGCGLGTAVIQKNTKLSQSFAVTTNYTFFSQLLGITFGTSGCNSSGLVMNTKEATMFAEANISSLKVEMARGQGENLAAFSHVMGCKDSSAFGRMTKDKYQNIFPSSDVGSHQMLDNVKAEIQKDQTLATNCTVAG